MRRPSGAATLACGEATLNQADDGRFSDTTHSGQSTWLKASGRDEAAALHLVVVWCRQEPERLGEVAAVTRRAMLGRGAEADAADAPKLELVRQRPGQNEPTGGFTSPKLSRRQWLVQPQGEAALVVSNLGQRQLLHNGRACVECTASEGDTLAVEGVLTCLVESRPRVLGSSPFQAFSFGSADPAGMVGESPAAWRLRAQLDRVAASRLHTLILGESGTGKERSAHAIHARSEDASGPFVARNAATIPAALIAAELFGNAAGYPNAGMPARKGLVGAAHGGTLFLDEVAEVEEAQQANLLRVLDGGEYHRLGEETARKTRFRFLAATNRDPSTLKHDFLARFVERLQLPSLNERKADIPLLIRHLLPQLTAAGAASGPGNSDCLVRPELVDALVRHRYTHHFRELERLLRLAERDSAAGTLELTKALEAELDLPLPAEGPSADAVRQALATSKSLVDAAASLGLPSRYALYRLLKKYGITPPNQR